ncbi:MAG: Asp-tRNA(Asn)/Glu-tRNA(Gln) amidotransferase subunit GatC [Patescibacteria group bacterium]
MISKEEIKKLADLARIDVADGEIENLRGEMDSILEYVGQIKKVAREAVFPSPEQGGGDTIVRGEVNVMREDTNPTESEKYSKELTAEFPDSENNYLKVKKIL